MASTRTTGQVRGWDGSSLGIGTLAGADPLGFAGGDKNLYRYVGNEATNAIDPNGTVEDQLPPKIDIPPPKLYSPIADPLPISGGPPYQIIQWPNNPVSLPSPPANWMSDPNVTAAWWSTWNDTVRLKTEQGFWVLWNPETGDVTTTRNGNLPPGRSHTANNKNYPQDISPVGDQDRAKNPCPGLPINGYVIIAHFHTHPGGAPNPGPGDVNQPQWIIPRFIIHNPFLPPTLISR